MDTSVLIKEIKDRDEKAASALEAAGLFTDAELQLLTQEDLHELLPGLKNFKLRKQVFDIIHKQKPINVVIKDLKAFIPDEFLRAALTSNGVLVNYLNVLKDLKTQMTKVQDFLDAQISLLEESSKSQPPQDQDKGSLPSTFLGSGSSKRHNSQTSNSPQIAGRHGSISSSLSKIPAVSILGRTQRTQAMLTYKMVVSGKTFDAHLQLLEKVKTSSEEPDLILRNQEESQSDQDCKVIIVFCPVVSRIGTDAENALKQAPDQKPVILVFMHHMHAAKAVTSPKTWDPSGRVVLCVHVFYHETVPGLLHCSENNAAITEIRQKLLDYSDKINTNITGNAENENSSWLMSFLPGKQRR